MAQPRRTDIVDPSRHSYTGTHFRQRLKNFVGTYVDTRTAIVERGIGEPNTQARLLENRLAEEEKLNKVDAKDVNSVQGEEKLVLFPTYARVKPHLFHGTHAHQSTSEHDLHVHGQVSIPHVANAPLRRKDRIILTVARQICGLPPLPSNGTPGIVKQKSMDILRKMSGRTSVPTTPNTESPTSNPMDQDEAFLAGQIMDEPDLIDLNSPIDAQSLRSDLSRASSKCEETLPVSRSATFPVSPIDTKHPLPPSRSSTMGSSRPSSPATTSPIKTTAQWKNAHNFPTLDLAQCHANLMERLAPFIARSVAGRLVTIKVYAPSPNNTDLSSRQIIAQRQFLTNDYGHFMGRLIVSPPQNQTPPETWTVTATLSSTKEDSAAISVREEVKFIPEHGISVISDIDDTVKHTSILSGARELFRNTFVRDLGSMSVDGVREWYSQMIDLGVQIHYVSNSPYQCWPIISSFMTAVGLPRGGSVHLKQYSGMISGIWENAADKKRAGVESIIRDFPRRKFILVGDSGEQDLELYTEMALTYRGQILGIFIRDVTTPLLQRNSGNSSSTISLPMFFDGNGQPVPQQQQQQQRKEGRLAQLRGLRDSWRGKSAEQIPTLAHFPTPTSSSSSTKPSPSADDDDPLSFQQAKDFERLTLSDMDLLSPFLSKADHAGEGITLTDLPLRKSKTPPPSTRPSMQRILSSSSVNSEPAGDGAEGFDGSTRSSTEKTVTEDPSSRVKRVENWKRRLARARERLFLLEGGEVEIWTWRVGGDVDGICVGLVERGVPGGGVVKRHGGNSVLGKDDIGVHGIKEIYTQ